MYMFHIDNLCHGIMIPDLSKSTVFDDFQI